MKDIKFVWQEGKPVTISPKLEMPDFILTAHNNTVCQRKTSTGIYYFLVFFFMFFFFAVFVAVVN